MAIAGKKYPLSIVVGTVDRATAGLVEINKQISRLTAPVRRLNNRLAALGKASGAAELRDRWQAAGRAVGGVTGAVKGVALALGAAAAAAGLGVSSIRDMVDAGDNLAKTAGVVNTTVDFLAQFRFAADRSGVAVGEVDGALGAFSRNLGKAKAGTGELTEFLNKTGPAFLRQIRRVKGTEEGLLLMADAIAKVKDPLRQSALASAAFGDAGAKLVPLLATGRAGVAALMKEYADLAGPQEAAAREAEAIKDAMSNMDAAIAGVRASIVSALGPALQQLLEQARRFFGENREAIGRWARDFGQRLPGAVQAAADAIVPLLAAAKRLWDAFGGARGAAVILGAVLAAKLVVAIAQVGVAVVSSVATIGKWGTVLWRLSTATLPALIRTMAVGVVGAFRAMSVAMLTTPIGWIVLGVGSLIAAGYLLWRNWDAVKAFFVAAWEVILDAFEAAKAGILVAAEAIAGVFGWLWGKASDFYDGIADRLTKIIELARGAARWLGFGGDDATATAAPTLAARTAPMLRAAEIPVQRAQQSEARVTVDFSNVPRGTRVSSDPRDTAEVDLSVGYQLVPG